MRFERLNQTPFLFGIEVKFRDFGRKRTIDPALAASSL